MPSQIGQNDFGEEVLIIYDGDMVGAYCYLCYALVWVGHYDPRTTAADPLITDAIQRANSHRCAEREVH